jgi:hypothetical protein
MQRTARAICALLAAVMLTGAACSAEGGAKKEDGGVKVGGKVGGNSE